LLSVGNNLYCVESNCLLLLGHQKWGGKGGNSVMVCEGVGMEEKSWCWERRV